MKNHLTGKMSGRVYTAPQGLVLVPPLLLIFINDLPRSLHADIKLFAHDTQLFSVVDDIDESASKLNNDLTRIQEWAYQWEMSFSSDRTKPAHGVIWSQKPGTYPRSDAYASRGDDGPFM